MTTLSKAPLLEAIFEIRWGLVKESSPNGIKEFNFPNEEINFFFGQFNNIAKKNELLSVERINPELQPLLPHIVIFRFRKASNTWPCYQVGLGIFTVNQVNDGYSWLKFKEDILRGIDILNEGHPLGMDGLSPNGIQLTYKDAFIFKENENVIEFLTNKLNFNVSLSQDFLTSTLLSPDIDKANLSFSLKSLIPEGVIIINLKQAIINGQPGIVMDTITRSHKDNLPEFNKDSISDWIEKAHTIQKHAFDTLINPVLARTFK